MKARHMRSVLCKATSVAAFLAVAANPTVPAELRERGRICIAAIPKPTSGEKSLANPRGGDPDTLYSVRVDNAPAINVSSEHGQWVAELSTQTTHTVSIYADGKRIESFKFDFHIANGDELCLWYKSLYSTWQLWPLKQCGAWCNCEPGAGSPNSALSPSHSAVTALAQGSKRRAVGRAG